MSINIKDIPKETLLRKLWENSAIAPFFSMNDYPAPAFDEQKAVNAVNGYIDYFQGRLIKCDISGDTADPWLYDRGYGPDDAKKRKSFQTIVTEIRNNK